MIWPMAFPLWTCRCGKPVDWIDAKYDLDAGKLVGVYHKECYASLVHSPDPHSKL